MANERACKTCSHYDPYDGGLDVNTNGDVVGGIDSDIGQCSGLGHIVEVAETDSCPHWEGDPPDNQQRARLEADVVQAALAWRRAGWAHRRMLNAILNGPTRYDFSVLPAYEDAEKALLAAADALLAFLGEGTDAG
jgi:hypothetical protein